MTIKHALFTFGAVAVSMAIVFRVAPLRKFITNSPT
jgi:hypothetical protein